MSRPVRPSDVVTAAELVRAALQPLADSDWSVPAGALEWSVERTIIHMIGAPAKYTLYVASRSPTFIALTMSSWPDATHEELLDSIVPVASGLAAVAEMTPPDVRAFHADGPTTAQGFLVKACVELLVHCHDAVTGLGAVFTPPPDLAEAVRSASFPDVAAHTAAWPALVVATGRPAP